MSCRMINGFFLSSLLFLALSLMAGCGPKVEPVLQLTEEERAEADYHIEKYTGREYDPNGKDVLLCYLILRDRKTPEKTVLKFAKYFVSQGADVNAKQNAEDFPQVHLRTPLHLAAGSNPDYSAKKNSVNVDLVKYLVSKGADVNSQSPSGTPLHEAVGHSNVDVVKYLVSKKSDVNAKTADGETPLHIAATNNFETKIAQHLISKGADVNAVERWGKTPLDLAEEKGNQVLAKYLSGQKSKKSGEPTSGPNSAAEKEIRDCFARYKTAILNRKGEDAAGCVSESTISHYYWVDIKVMRHQRNDLEKLPLLERILVLSMRHQVPYVKLHELSLTENRDKGKAYFVYAVDNGMIGRESVEKLELASVFIDSVDGKKAKTIISSDGKKAPFGFEFVLQEGEWKIDLTSIFPITEEALKAVILQSGISESQFIMATLEKSTGKKPDDSIWSPPKPNAQEQKIVEEMQKKHREEQEKIWKEKIASGEITPQPSEVNQFNLPRVPRGGRPNFGFTSRFEEPGLQQAEDDSSQNDMPDYSRLSAEERANLEQRHPGITSDWRSNEAPVQHESIRETPASRNFTSRPQESGRTPRTVPNFERSLGMSMQGTSFSETVPDNGVLVGFQVTFKKWGNNDCIESIQPLYRSLKTGGGKRGQVHGHADGESKRVYAPDGYAVGGLNGRVGAVVDGFELIYMKIKPDGTLDPNDTQISEWVGNDQGGVPGSVNGNGKPITEIKGYTGDHLSSLELVFQ